MKKILIVIYNLAAGGAQKSLVSFLNTLPSNKYEIDLFLLNKEGLFLPQVPSFVNIFEADKTFKSVHHTIFDIKFFKIKDFSLWLKVLISRLKSQKYKQLHKEQVHWLTFKKYINFHLGNKTYDCAISYVEGITNYFVIDKVKAKRKVLWIHNVYTSLHYNISFDYNYFKKANNVVTMSESGLSSLQNSFPTLKNKFSIIENITNSSLIKQLSIEPIKEKEFYEFKGLKLLSIGRLMEQKNFPLAIATAAELKKKNINFIWYVIGEGPDRPVLETLIQKYSLQNNFKLIGLRTNPYQYMRIADMIIMTSKFEGRPIVLDEAKILHKLIISTNYTSVSDVIDNQITGIVCDMKPNSICKAIIKLNEDKELSSLIINNLKNNNWDNTHEIRKYYEIIEGI